jgi:hypothetical protein
MLPIYAFSSESVETLENTHNKNVSSPSGKKYNEIAVSHIFKNAKFMRICAPPNGPKAESFTFYIIVSKGGKVIDLTVTPVNKTSACFKEHVVKMTFPKPSMEFVVKEKMEFY